MSLSDCKEMFLPLYLAKLNFGVEICHLDQEDTLALLRMTFCLLLPCRHFVQCSMSICSHSLI